MAAIYCTCCCCCCDYCGCTHNGSCCVQCVNILQFEQTKNDVTKTAQCRRITIRIRNLWGRRKFSTRPDVGKHIPHQYENNHIELCDEDEVSVWVALLPPPNQKQRQLILYVHIEQCLPVWYKSNKIPISPRRIQLALFCFTNQATELLLACGKTDCANFSCWSDVFVL